MVHKIVKNEKFLHSLVLIKIFKIQRSTKTKQAIKEFQHKTCSMIEYINYRYTKL